MARTNARAYNPDKERKVKLLFFRYHSTTEIARELGVSVQNIHEYLKRRPEWREEREKLIQEVGELAVQRNILEVNEIFKYGLPLIKNSLKARAEEGTPLEISEAKQVTDIMTAFDKLMRLEAGKPTDIQADVKPVTIEELKQVILKEDDFIQLEVNDAGSDKGKGRGDSTAGEAGSGAEGSAAQDGRGA